MGTNYYAIPIIDDAEKEKICNCIRDEEYEKAMCLMPQKIHIGKKSHGWIFLFNHNNWSWYKDTDGLREFLKTCRIYNEYEDCVSYDKFWEIVEDTFIDGIDNVEYYTNWDKYNLNPRTNKPFPMTMPIPENYGEIKDGKYRYSTSTEFS